jgi:glycosyltransferase involved in cell wall biosynthesis
MTQNPKISVTVLTYNLEAYIEQCLNSILEQIINCDIEIIIGDDCSTDKTCTILLEFKKRYPKIIKLILREKNIGVVKNYIDTMQQCHGEYIAHIDGDDFMLPNSLQKKADYLDKHPECVLVHNRTLMVDTNSHSIKPSSIRKATRGDINNLIVQNGITNSAKMFRRSSLTSECFEIPKYNIGHDWFFDLRLVQKSKICYLPDILTAYRIHTSSAMKKSNIFQVTKAEMYVINSSKELKNILPISIAKGKSIIYATLSRHYLKKNHPKRAWIFFKASLKEYYFNLHQLKLLFKFFLTKLNT